MLNGIYLTRAVDPLNRRLCTFGMLSDHVRLFLSEDPILLLDVMEQERHAIRGLYYVFPVHPFDTVTRLVKIHSGSYEINRSIRPPTIRYIKTQIFPPCP